MSDGCFSSNPACRRMSSVIRMNRIAPRARTGSIAKVYERAMQDEQIQEMSLLEAEHWWYRGLRHMIEQTLRVHAPVSPSAKVLDAGCGTGENLRLLRSVLRPSYLGGFDIS